MHILRRLPFEEGPSAVAVAGEIVPVRAYQIIVWVSLSMTLPEGVSMYPTRIPAAPRLPLIGIRGLMRGKLRLVVDDMVVSLSEHPKKRS